MKRRRVLQRSLWGRGLVWLTILNMGGFQCLPAFALPHGEQVTHGEVTFARDGNRLTVTQASGKAIVNYHSFDIGVMESVQFAQPGATAAILNRVVGGAGSEIAGSLLANGQVYLINPQGILFSSSARVNVGGLVASAMPMADSDFLAGRLFFSGAGGAVINEGALGGRFIYLIGSQVENRGTITAPEVVMAAGQRSVVIDRAAGGQIRLVIDDEVEVVESDDALADALQEDESGADVVASTGGEAVETAVEVGSGTTESGAAVAADSGVEQTTAETLLEQVGEWLAAAGDAASAEETGMDGVLTASDVEALGSLAAGPVVSDWDAGTVVNEGVVDASGLSGGAIALGGVAVHQDGTLIADGTEGGGGTIRVVGEDYVVATGNSLTTANAGVDGNGGDIRILSPNAAGVDAGALIEARGGTQGGDGGFVEVSGTQYVQMQGRADLRAENGEAGTLLIDPADINISNDPGTGSFLGGDWQTGDSPSELNITTLLDQLQLGNVIVNTSVGNTTELGSGTITVVDAIDYAAGTTDLLGIGQGNSLDLIADADIVVNGSITGGPGHDLNLNLTAGSNVVVAATIQTGGGGFSSTGIGFDNTGGFIDAGGGAVQIQHSGDVTIGGAVQTTGGAGGIVIEGAAIDFLADVTTDQEAILTATQGAISQGGGTISADGLALRATTGIGDAAPLQTAVNTLAAENTAGGAIHIQNDNAGAALAVGVVNELSGVSNTGGGITIVNQGALSVDSQVAESGGGDIVLTASGSADSADLAVNDHVAAFEGDGSILLTAGDSILQNAGDVTAGGAGTVTYTASTGTVSGAINMTDGSVSTAAGDIQFDAEGDISLHVVGSAGGSISAVSSTGSVTFLENVMTGGGDLLADAGAALTTAGIDTAGGAVELLSGDALGVSGPVSTGGGAVDGQAGGAITFLDTVQTAGGDLALTSSGGDIGMQGAVATSGGSVSATATVGSVSFAADLNSGAGAIDVTAGTDATFSSASGAVTTSNATVTVAAGNNADFQGNLATGGGAISVTASNDVTLAAVDSGGGGLFLDAGVLLTVNGPVSTGGGAVDGQAGGAITFLDTVQTAGGNLALTSSGGDIGMQGAVATSGGSVSATATAGSVSFAADLNSGAGAIDVTAGTDATFNSSSGAVTTSNATVTVAAGNNADFQGNLATGGGAISVTASNDVTLAAVDSGDGDVALQSGNTLDLSTDLSAGAGALSLTSTAGDITQSAGTITAADLVFDSAGTVNLVQAGNAVGTVAGVSDGTITLVDGGDLEVGTVNLTSGLASNGNDIDVTAAGGLTLSADVDAGTANLFLTATSGDTSQSAGAITADELEVVSGGAATLESAGNAVNVIAGSSGGAFSYVDAGDLTVGATTGQTGLSGDGVAVSAAGDLDVEDVITSSGGNVRLTADSDLSGAGSLTITEAVNTGGGDFVASAYDFENTEFGLNNGTITTAGGDVDITAENSALIRGDILSGGVGTNGTISVNAPSLTLRNVNLDTGGAGPPLVIGGGYSTIGFVNLLGDGTIILNQAFPDLVIDGQVIDFGTEGGTLNAARDIILINGGSVVSDPTGSITVHADSDGLINTNLMGAAYGGIYVDDASSIDSGGALTILGAESLVNPGYAILIEGTVTSVDALLIDGRNPVSGTQPETDVGLDGSAVSTAGGISLLAQRDLTIDGTLETQGANDIVLDALRDVAVNNDLTSGNNVDVTAGGAISSAGGAIAGGTITFAAVDGIGSAANPISVSATTLDAVNSGTGEIGLANDNSVDALVTVGSLTTTGDITYTQTGTADLLLGTALSSGGGEISVDAENDLDLSAAVSVSGGNLNLGAGVLLTVNGPVSTGGGAMDAAAGGTLTLADAVDTAGGDLSLASTGGDITAVGTLVTAGGVLTADAAVGAVDLQADVNAGSGEIDVTAGTDATFNSVSGATTTSNAGVTVAAGNNATFQGGLATGGGTIDVTAGNAITTAAAVDSAGGDLLLDAGGALQLGGAVSTGGGSADLTAVGTIDLLSTLDTGGGDLISVGGAFSSTGGGIATGGGSVSLNHAGVTTLSAGVATAGGDFTARGESLDNTGGVIDTGTGAAGTGGAIDIAMNDQAVIGSDLISGDAGIDGGDITVIASNNTTMAVAGGLTVNGNLNSQGGTGGTLTIGGGTTLGGTVSVGAGDIFLNGGGLDLFIAGAQAFDANTGLIALRDIVISESVTTLNGANLTIEADVDGIANTDGLGTAFGGVLVQGAATIESSGSLVILGSELLAAGGAPAAVSLAGAGNTANAAGNILIRGKAEAPAGSGVNLSGAVSSSGGSISILSAEDIAQGAAVATLAAGQTIDVESTGGSVSMGAGASATTADGNVRYAAAQDVQLGALNAGVGNASITAGGSIRDANAAAINVTAAEARFSAGNAAGDLALDDRIETQVGTVAAEAGAGGIGLEEADGVVVGSVGPVSVNRVQTDASTQAEADAAALDGLTTGADGSIVQLAGSGELAVDEAIAANGAGNVLVSSAAGTVALNTGVTSGSGSIQVAADSGLTQAAAGDIQTGGAGTILVLNDNGGIVMADGAQATTAGGDIHYVNAVDGGITIGQLDAGTGRVGISSAGGILDAGDTGGADITASETSLLAAQGIGTGADALETATAVLEAQADDGGIFLANAGAVTVGPLAAQPAANRVNTDGSLGAAVLPAAIGGLSALADGAIVLSAEDTITVNGNVNAGGTGNLLLQALGSGNIDLNALVASAGGSVSILAGGNISMNAAGANLSSGGSLDVEAAGGSITMADGATAVTGGGNILMRAGEDVTLGGVHAGAGSIQVRAMTGSIVDGGDAEIDLIAAAASLLADNAVGSGADAIEIMASDVAAEAGAGGIFVAAAGGTDISSLAGFNVNRVGADGGIAAQGSEAVDGFSTVSDGDIVVTADTGDLTVNAAVTAGGSGNVLLRSTTSGEVILNQAVQSGSGNITLSAAELVQQNLDGDIATTGGDVHVASGTGPIVMFDGATTTTDGGNILYEGGGDVFLGGLDAGAGAVHAASANGGILDGGDADIDVIAANASFSAPNGLVGILETDVDVLAAIASGEIMITDINDVTVGSVAPVEVQSVSPDGGTAAVSSAPVDGLTTTTAGSIVLQTLDGDLMVDALVSAGGAGNILLGTQAGGDVVLRNAGVESGSGSISLLAADNVQQSATGDITTGAGSIDVEAMNGSITMADGAVAQTAGAGIRYAATGDVTLGSLATPGGAVEVSADGSILDGGDGARDVIANSAQLSAAGSVGTNADKIDTQVGTVAARAAADGIYLENLGAVSVGDASAANVNRVGSDGTTTVLAGATLSDLATTAGDGNIVLTANDAITIADGANPADGFGVSADGAGNILLMTMGAGDIVLDAGVQSGSGSISILANDSLIQNAGGVVQTVGGSIDLEATTGTLTLDGGLQTGGADIALTSTGDITLAGIDAGAGNVSVNSTGGSILSGAGPTDITAASAGLQAANAVGNLPGGDPIETAVDTIAASAGAGGINLIDADALTVGDFSGATVNRVAMDGTTSPNNTAGALIGETTTSGGSIVQQAGGTLTVDASIDADGAGNVLLRSSGGDIVLNQAGVQSGSGAIHIEGLAVNQQADADIQTGGAGTIQVNTLGGGITMADGATATTAGGDIAYQAAAGDIVLGGLNAGGGSVAVIATDGSILDGGDTDTDITAAASYLDAATGANSVGTSQDAIDAETSTLAARAGGGGMYLDSIGAVSIDDVSGLAADVSANGTQGAGFAFGASDLVTANAGNIILTADDTITVNDGVLTANGIGVAADGTGNVLLQSSGGDVILTSAAQTGGGSLSLDAAQSIQQSAAGDILTAGGTIDLAAGTTVTMADGAVAASGDGNILVQAGGDIMVGSLDAGAGRVHVNSTAGSVLDGGDVDTDVIGAAASFVAGDSVGEVAGANALETQVGTGAAEAGAGGISLIDLDGVTVGDVAAVDVNRVLTDGTTESVSGAAVSGHSTAADGSIVQRTQNGTLTIESAVNADGAGNVLVQTQGAGSDVVLNQAVTSGSGNITALAANTVTQTADGDITTGGGTIDVQALTGDITMADGATAVTGGGNIRYTAGGGVTLGGLDAGVGDVAVTAAGGSITDGGDADADIAASAARLSAQGGIGTGADPLDAAVATLAVNAGQGGIFVDNMGAVAVDTVGLVGVNRVQLDGTTAVEQSAATAEDLRTLGGDIVLIADDTITVNAGTAATGGVLAGGAGNVLLLAAGQGDVNLNASVGSGTGSLSILAASSVNQGADGDLFTAGAGSIDVEASTGAIVMDDLASASAGADILYDAVGDVTLGSLASSTGGVAVRSSAGSILDGGDSAIDVTALSAVFQAGNGVGNLSAGDALETAVDIVGAEAGAGGISLIDGDEVTVGAAQPVSVNRVSGDGTISPVAGPAIAGLTTMDNGSIVQRTLDGSLTVDSLVGADGAGNILLQSVNSGPVQLLGAGARSGSGHITVLSAGELMQSADGDLQTGGGDIVATAAFGIFMDQGAAGTSGGGNIRYTASGGDAMLASLDAGAGEVAVTADGSILDNGDDAREVIGSAARLQAGDAIGTSTDKLETQVSVLAANAAAGGIFLDNQGAVTVGDVDPVAADQVAADGSLNAVADASGLSDLATGNGGSIVLVADDTITVADGGQPADGLGVNADGAGNVLLRTLGQGDIVLQSGVRSGTGSISVLSAGGIEQTADGDLTTAGAGTIDVEAMGGSISMAEGAESATAGGNIRYAGAGNVTVSAVDAGNGLLSIGSSGGAIAQSADSRIVGSAARLSASAGIGTEAAPLSTTVDTVAAVTDSGGVYLTEADGVTVGSVGPVAVNRVGMDGLTTPESDPALSGISANSGDILVTTTDGDLFVSAPVAAGTGNIVMETLGAAADLHVLNAVSSGGDNVVLRSARDVNLAAEVRADRDVAIWADTDTVGEGAINQTAGVAEAVNGHMFLAADDIVQTGATSQFRVPNGTLIVEVNGDLNLGSTLIGGGVQAESFVAGAQNIIVDTLITVAETLIFRADDSIFHSPGNTSGSILSQSIAMRAGGDIGRAGNQDVDFLRVNSEFLGTFASGNEFLIEADNTESAGPVLLITAGFEYPDSGPEFAELIPRPFEDLLAIEGLFDGIEADDVLNIIVGGDLTGTAIVSGGDAIIRVTGSVMLDEIRIGGAALDIRVGGDFNVGIFEASVVDLLDVAGNGNVGSFTVVNYANAVFGGSFSGQSMDVGGPLDLNVGGNWVYDRVELGAATDRIVVGGSADVGSLQDDGSLDLSVGGNYSGGSLSVAGLLDAAISGNMDLGSLNAGTLQADVRGSGAIDSFNVSGNATANFGGSLTGASMDIGGVTDLTVGGDWDYDSAVFGGNALVRVTGGANVADLLANSNLDAVIGGSFAGTSFGVNSDAILDVGGDWMYDTVMVGNSLDAVVDGQTQAGDFSAGTMILDSGSAEFDNLDVSGDSTAVIGADMTLGTGNVGGDADWTTGGNLDIVELSVDGSLLASVDGTLSFEEMTAGNVEIDAGAIDLGRLTTGSAQIAAGGAINNNGAFINASTLNMTAGGNIGSNGSIPMNVGTIQTISGGGNVDITQLATGDTLVGLLRAGGTLDVGVPNGGLVDNNGEGLNIASGGDSRFSAQYLGTVADALEVDIGGNLFVDGAGLSGNDLPSQVRVFVNVVGDIAGAGRRIQYIGDVSIPGLVFLNGQLLLGDQFLLLEVARTEAFVVETPEIKSPQGVFGDPYFIHLYMQISEAWNLFLDFILFGEAQVNADPEMPPDAKRTIKIGGTEKPYAR